jgi:SET domain-containing protein
MRAANEAGEPHFYMMELSPGLVIDARKKGNLARLINSSCDPNCESQKWHDAATGEVRIGIFAMRDIEPGEELTYDYQFQHSGVAAAALGYR